MMGLRFDQEVARFFHADVFRREWLDEAVALTRALGEDTADGLEQILEHVQMHKDGDQALVEELSARLRETERRLARSLKSLARTMFDTIGGGPPLSEMGDRVATPLQLTQEAR